MYFIFRRIPHQPMGWGGSRLSEFTLQGFITYKQQLRVNLAIARGILKNGSVCSLQSLLQELTMFKTLMGQLNKSHFRKLLYLVPSKS